MDVKRNAQAQEIPTSSLTEAKPREGKLHVLIPESPFQITSQQTSFESMK